MVKGYKGNKQQNIFYLEEEKQSRANMKLINYLSKENI